jgi:glycosyltransferase involved in cell wall biosynthesis
LYGLEARRLRRKEIQWANQFDHTILITHHEAEPLINRVGRRKVMVVGNGIAPEVLSHNAALPTAPAVGFVGAMDYKPNVDAVQWFCRNIWPHVLTLQPDAVFRIIGRNPTPQVKQLADLPGVEVVGAVNELYPVIGRLQVSVAPLRIARGLQNKVLEAMALARPVVLTQAAARGIDATNNEHFLIADTPENFAARVVYLLTDEGAARRIGAAAKQYVADNHQWPTEMRKLEAALTAAATIEPPPVTEPVAQGMLA